jgi:hypothetical protein
MIYQRPGLSIDLSYLNRSVGGGKALSLAGNIETTVSEFEVFGIPNNRSASKGSKGNKNAQ